MLTIRSGYVLFHDIHFMKKDVPYTCNSGELIQIGTETWEQMDIHLLFQLYFSIIIRCYFITPFTNSYIYRPF